jgi:hypothetical protein
MIDSPDLDQRGTSVSHHGVARRRIIIVRKHAIQARSCDRSSAVVTSVNP